MSISLSIPQKRGFIRKEFGVLIVSMLKFNPSNQIQILDHEIKRNWQFFETLTSRFFRNSG